MHSEEETKFMKENHATLGPKKLVEILNCSYAGILSMDGRWA